MSTHAPFLSRERERVSIDLICAATLDTTCPHVTLAFFSHFQIAPSAKKLWGVDDGGSKDEGGVKGGGILHLGDHQMWRDSTWSTSGTMSIIAVLVTTMSRMYVTPLACYFSIG